MCMQFAINCVINPIGVLWRVFSRETPQFQAPHWLTDRLYQSCRGMVSSRKENFSLLRHVFQMGSLNFFDTRTALLYNFASNGAEYFIKKGATRDSWS